MTNDERDALDEAGSHLSAALTVIDWAKRGGDSEESLIKAAADNAEAALRILRRLQRKG